MSFPTHSNISQNDTEMLKEQCRKMQQRHEEQQQSLLQLQETAEAHHAEHVAQKARREAEAKRQRVVEEEERKKRTMEHLQQLQNKVLEKEAALLEEAEGSEVVGSKCKEVTTKDEEGQ